MKVPIYSDIPVEVDFWVKFHSHEPLWKMETNPSRVRLSGSATNYDLAIPGRRPQEIEYFILRYDEKEVKLYPDIDDDGEMKPIIIYDGSRDYWTHALRQKALASQ
jgi:hypothetical protein